MCKTLEEQLGSISDVTLYRYLYTANDATRQRALAINCHHNPPEALRDHLLYGLHSEEAPKEDCAAREGEKLKQIKEETGDADRAELPVLTFPDGYETRILAATSEELDSWITMHQPAKSDDKPAEAEPVTTADGNATAATDNPAPASDEDSDPTPTDIQPAQEDRAPASEQPIDAKVQPAPDETPAANPNGGRIKIDAPPIRPRS
jgi:thiol:disulphide interchange protein